MRSKRSLAVAILLVMISAAAILLLRSSGTPARGSLNVQFLGYTNLPSGNLRFALFTMANADRVPLRWRGVATEIDGDSNLKAPVINGALPWITSSPIKSGQSILLAVGEPYEGEQWRVQLRFSRCTFHERLHQFAMSHKVPAPISLLVPNTPPVYTLNTSWIKR